MKSKEKKHLSLSVETIKFLEDLSKELFGYVNLSITIDYIVVQFGKSKK